MWHKLPSGLEASVYFQYPNKKVRTDANGKSVTVRYGDVTICTVGVCVPGVDHIQQVSAQVRRLSSDQDNQDNRVIARRQALKKALLKPYSGNLRLLNVEDALDLWLSHPLRFTGWVTLRKYEFVPIPTGFWGKLWASICKP